MLNVQQVERDLIVQSHFNQNRENVGSNTHGGGQTSLSANSCLMLC